MRHLLIDEFQDISGQIVKWIKAVHESLAIKGYAPSLLVVGDSWQSIYGWRGSDPVFMLQFEKHFGDGKLIVMNENFRCGQQIINVAEELVASQGSNEIGGVPRHGRASGPASGVFGVAEFRSGGDAEIMLLVDELRRDDPQSSIYVLSRTNEGLSSLRKGAKSRKLMLYTMHKSKGLEADYVIVKGECGYNSVSSLRNAIYHLAQMGVSYDVAQAEESKRLAYVSLTRARKKVFWFGENPGIPVGAADAKK
jgi:superfamily I DNA/RNA helicase